MYNNKNYNYQNLSEAERDQLNKEYEQHSAANAKKRYMEQQKSVLARITARNEDAAEMACCPIQKQIDQQMNIWNNLKGDKPC